MAKTIIEIQAAIDAQNLDARQLINLIVDYLQANPPGGGGSIPTLEQVLGASDIKVYNALLTQSSEDAPVPSVSQNTIGNVIWTRNGPGNYTATLLGAFLSGKTLFFMQNTSGTDIIFKVIRNDDNSITVGVYDGGSPTDDYLENTPIKIEVYP